MGAVPGSIHAQTSLLSSPFDRYRGWKRVSREELGVSGENLDTDGAPAIGVHRVSAVHVSSAMAPFKLDVATPFSSLPEAVSVNFPKATLGPTPMTVPLSLNVQVAAARDSEHADSSACAAAGIPRIAKGAAAISSAWITWRPPVSNRGSVSPCLTNA